MDFTYEFFSERKPSDKRVISVLYMLHFEKEKKNGIKLISVTLP